MARRYLFGPVTPPFADQCLNRVRKEETCLTFDADGKTDLAIGPADSWGQVCGRFPAGWQPDFIALWLPYTSIPACLWSAPVPVVGLALDWPLLWHYYRRRLRSCDLTFIDPPGVEALAAEGISHVRPANLYGCDRAFLDLLPNDGAANNPEVAGARQADAATVRDIDVLCVGNMNPAVQRQRLPWLMRLARLGKRWRVAIHAGVFGDSYRKLLSRARIVFNQVAQPRCSRRVFEAAAAGALLFEDAANPATAAYFGDRQECVYYNADNLEALLEHYLTHESERQALAEAGRKRACDFTFEAYWEGIVNEIEEEWPALLRRARRRRLPGKREDLLLRSWQALSAPLRADPALTRDLEKALAAEPESHALRHALGLTLSRAQADASAAAALAAVAAGHFQQAVAGRPENLIARLNLVEALHAAGQKEAAIEQAHQTLAALSLLPEINPEQLEGGYFPADYGLFRVEWEKAAWSNAGQPVAEIQAKLALLRWQLHILLARLTGDVVHSYEALLARPDLSYSAAALGCTLAREHPLEALAPLAQALAGNPFEREAARALHHVLGVLGDQQSRRLLVEERRLLARAAPHVAPAEAWFSEPPPSPQDLASIIILCCNQVDYTRLCLESVLAHTRAPYELIVVDNGSTDGTQAYLAELRSRPGPVRVDVVRNDVNHGFPAGCNQGLARARGRYFIFLNNDTVVTPGWLDGLVGGSLRDWPSVGLVGAVTNHAPDAQGVRGDYKGLDCLAEFADRRRREYAGQVLDVRRLTGFCLLVRRDVFERIGKFDERFGVGFFDDDDLCLRSREAGFRLLVALDVYIHHFGSRTFKGLGINSREQLSKNFDMFRAKWGAEQVAGYRLMGPWPEPKRDDEIAPDVVAEPAGAMAQPSEAVLEPMAGLAPREDVFVQAEEISSQDASVVAQSPGRATGPTEEAACTPEVIAGNLAQVLVGLTPEPRRLKNALTMIVKNEETRLPACLESAGDLFDEVIVVDTGSTDNTKEVALRYGARVYDFPWVDSFAAARNEALRHATARWIMWLDADDRLDHQNRERVRLLFDGLGGEMAAYAVKVRSVLDAANLSFRLLDQVRIFPNHPEVRWDYRVHEQTLPGVLRLGGQIRWSDIVVDHVGYQQVEVRRSKLERNLRLLEMDDAERPDDAFTLFNLGWTMMDLGQTEQALPRLKRSLERSSPDSSIARKLYHLIAIAHRHFGQKDEALKVCRDGLERYPDDSELLFEEASLLLDAKEVERAEINLLRLVETRPGPYFGSVDDGMRGYKTRDLLARLYRDQGRTSEAEIQWRAAVAEKPSFLPAWLGLGELHLCHGRWADLEQAAYNAEVTAGAALEAALLRARAHQARKEFAPARRLLEQVIPRAPEALAPRVLLSHVLLQEDKDPSAAEQALHDVLARDAANSEARHNLAVLRRKQGKSAPAEICA
jgi:GT2 family glycosyltransferase/tetratricopeptide (TPR) repeat protein